MRTTLQIDYVSNYIVFFVLLISLDSSLSASDV